jgi:antitoxin MazE
MDLKVPIRSDAMKVCKWGNSLAVRLPAAIVEILGLKEGGDIEIRVAGTRTLHVEQKLDREELLNRLRRFRGMLPADFKFDRDKANSR